jgi:hypothetical protein
VFVGGVLLMLTSAGVGAVLGWENRNTVVRVRLGHLVWTGHLYAVLVVGALLVCWFMLGVAFVQCRLAERRGVRRARAATTAAPVEPVAQQRQQPRPRVPAGRPGRAVLQR